MFHVKPSARGQRLSDLRRRFQPGSQPGTRGRSVATPNNMVQKHGPGGTSSCEPRREARTRETPHAVVPGRTRLFIVHVHAHTPTRAHARTGACIHAFDAGESVWKTATCEKNSPRRNPSAHVPGSHRHRMCTPQVRGRMGTHTKASPIRTVATPRPA